VCYGFAPPTQLLTDLWVPVKPLFCCGGFVRRVAEQGGTGLADACPVLEHRAARHHQVERGGGFVEWFVIADLAPAIAGPDEGLDMGQGVGDVCADGNDPAVPSDSPVVVVDESITREREIVTNSLEDSLF
jgi:hypothetical protein